MPSMARPNSERFLVQELDPAGRILSLCSIFCYKILFVYCANIVFTAGLLLSDQGLIGSPHNSGQGRKLSGRPALRSQQKNHDAQ